MLSISTKASSIKIVLEILGSRSYFFYSDLNSSWFIPNVSLLVETLSFPAPGPPSHQSRFTHNPSFKMTPSTEFPYFPKASIWLWIIPLSMMHLHNNLDFQMIPLFLLSKISPTFAFYSFHNLFIVSNNLEIQTFSPLLVSAHPRL